MRKAIQKLVDTLNANPQGCNQYGCKGGGGSSQSVYDKVAVRRPKVGQKVYVRGGFHKGATAKVVDPTPNPSNEVTVKFVNGATGKVNLSDLRKPDRKKAGG